MIIHKRALRRHHYNRRKRNARYIWFGTRQNPNKESFCAFVANTPHPCSCEWCGNPRKHFNERTIQEKKNDAVWNEEKRFLNCKNNK